jgi:hypothetical protein
MELLSCFQKISFKDIQLGMSFERFQQIWSPEQPVKKEIFSIQDNAYGCRLKGAEFMFIQDELESVKIDILHEFFKESKQVFRNLSMDKCVEQWTENQKKWDIDRLHTAKQRIVLICEGVIHEFLFTGNKFKLHQIRLMKINSIQNNRYLIGHLELEIEELSQ